MPRLTVLVAGSSGLVGRAVANCFAADSDIRVIGLSRRPPDASWNARAEHRSVDLLNGAACLRALEDLGEVTHLVYAAWSPKTGDPQSGATPQSKVAADVVDVANNLAMFRNLLDATDASRGLRHVTLLQGSKAYGMHFGRVEEPAKETDPRVMPPNWYYDQEDLMKVRCQGKGWGWTIFRPVGVFGFAAGSQINPLTMLGVYAALCKHLKVPLRYPGSHEGYRQVRNAVDSDLVAKAIRWAAENPRCRGEIFNVGNGDLYSWQRLWPRVAALFGIEMAPPLPMPLSIIMPQHAATWEAMKERHGLAYGWNELTEGAWPLADVHFNMSHGALQDALKLRKFGFQEFCDTEEMIERKLREVIAARVIPG
jgi:nucleoside-diphosphate-sugar epimerase